MSELKLSSDVAQLGRVVDALRDADGDIPRNVLNTLRDIADRIVEVARAQVEAEPTHGLKHRGLRTAIAEGTRSEPMPDGARVEVEMPGWPGQNSDSLPYDMNSGDWMHPVFDKDPWVKQGPYTPWFDDAVDMFEVIAEREVEVDLDDAIKHIEAA